MSYTKCIVLYIVLIVQKIRVCSISSVFRRMNRASKERHLASSAVEFELNISSSSLKQVLKLFSFSFGLQLYLYLDFFATLVLLEMIDLQPS